MKSNNIDSIIANACASLAVEGMKPSEAGVLISRKYLEGKISSREAIRKIKETHLNAAAKCYVR